MYEILTITLIFLVFYIPISITRKTERRIMRAVKYCELADAKYILETLCSFHESERMPEECIIGICEERSIALRIIEDFKRELPHIFLQGKLPSISKKGANNIINFLFLHYILSDTDLIIHYMFTYLSKAKGIDYSSDITVYGIVLKKIMLISHLHSFNLKISGYFKSDADQIKMDIKNEKRSIRIKDSLEKYAPYTGNDPDIGIITREYVETKAFELGLLTSDVLNMINDKRRESGVKKVYEDEIL